MAQPTQEFQERVIDSLARIETNLKNHGERIAGLGAKVEAIQKDGCAMSKLHQQSIVTLEKVDSDQWKEISKLRNGKRNKAIALGGTAAGGGGLIYILSKVIEHVFEKMGS